MEELDTQTPGQMSIDDLFDPEDRLIAVSRIFAKARKSMSVSEQKAFIYALSQIQFTQPADSQMQFDTTKRGSGDFSVEDAISSEDAQVPFIDADGILRYTVHLDKKKLAKIIGINDNSDHLSTNLARTLSDLPKHSAINIVDTDKGTYDSGTIINRILINSNPLVFIQFNPVYLKFFTGLTKDYITMWSSDIFSMNTKRAILFYEVLRNATKSDSNVNTKVVGVRALKELFDIPKDGAGSYMRKDGHFDRPSFERYVIEPLCKELANCKMINLVVQEDGKLYKKKKSGRLVDGYEFNWTYTKHPGIATANEIKKIQEQIIQDPKILKVANDILSGEKKEKKKPNQFHNFNQRKEVDLDEIVNQRLVARSMSHDD